MASASAGRKPLDRSATTTSARPLRYNGRMNQQSPDDEQPRHDQPDESEHRPVSAWQVVASSLAAAFGVQSSRNRQRDFTHGKAVHFIIAGIVITVLFVLLMVIVVNLVMSGVGR